MSAEGGATFASKMAVAKMNAAFRFVISYYIWQNKFINFVCVRQQPGWAERSWSVPGSVDEMLAAFLHAGEKLRRMMGKPTPCSKWGQLTGGHALKWTKDRVTLLGNSAHAMLATLGKAPTWTSRTLICWPDGFARMPMTHTRRFPATKRCANRGRQGCRNSLSITTGPFFLGGPF